MTPKTTSTPASTGPDAAPGAVTVGSKTFDTLWGLVSRRVRLGTNGSDAGRGGGGASHRPHLATVVTVNGSLLVLRPDDPGARRLERVSVDLIHEVLDRAEGTD